ncbi:MAG: PAS domain S-box protein [Magnetococcales bacterium]|nr:PAS domain S-box protein [Magnetococcales bacterium]
MNELLLESIRALVVLFLFLTLLKAGREKSHLPHNGWSRILLGFGLILFGSLMDITDNFESLGDYGLIGHTTVQSFLKNVVGYIGGFILVTIGLKEWLPFVAGVEELSEMAGRLAVSKERLEVQHATLYSNEQRFRAIFNNSAVGIATLHPNGCFDQVNLTYQDILGYNAAELAGLRWWELAVPDDLQASEKLFKQVEEGTLVKGVLDRVCWKKEGTTLLCRDRLTAIREGENRPVSYYILLMDEVRTPKNSEA